jgi:hypothetical protein
VGGGGERGGERRLAPLLGPARLIPDADEQRRDVLAVLAALREGGARAVRLDAVRRELHRDGIRIRVGRAHGPARAHLVDLDVVDDAASEVLEASEERAGAEEPAQAAVAQRGEGVGDLRHTKRS